MRAYSPSPLLLALGLLAACPGPQVRIVGPRPAASAASSSASSSPSAPTGPGAVPIGGSVKTPVFSDDACSEDADCVPLRTCHPDRCVSHEKAGTLLPGTLCTEICMAGTLDCGFNHCGCAEAADGKKKCAVLPGGKN